MIRVSFETQIFHIIFKDQITEKIYFIKDTKPINLNNFNFDIYQIFISNQFSKPILRKPTLEAVKLQKFQTDFLFLL